MDNKQQRLLVSAVGIGISLYLTYRLLRAYEAMTAPSTQLAAGNKLADRLKQRGITVELNEYERAVCADLVFAEDVTVGFDNVAGLDNVKRGLLDVIAPFQAPKGQLMSKLLSAPKGVLLYGSPGNGKTLLATALARECGASFLNIKSSTLFQKFVGESEKMALAVFTLARKIQPCIVFLDEVDLVLSRDSLHVSNNKVIGILLSEWDGLSSSGDSNNVVVVAASNNPKNIDTALHRRLPRQFFIPPPDEAQRLKILIKILRDEKEHVPRTVSLALLEKVAIRTDKYCASDLLELSKVALGIAMRDEMGERFEWRHFEEAMLCVRYAGASSDDQMMQEMKAM